MEKTDRSSSKIYIFIIIILVVALFQTWDRRYNDGYYDGYDKAFDLGNERGYKNGYSEGKEEGFDQGYDLGKDDGYDRGYSDGYSDGIAQLKTIETYEDGYFDSYLSLVSYYESPNRFDYTVIPMLPVSSSFIDSVGYSPRYEILLIHMNGKNLYAYHGVSSSVFISIATAESPGSYFNSSIKDKYQFTKYY